MSDWHDWFVGQRVVCVDDEFTREVYSILREKCGCILPEAGKVYIIREVMLFDFADGLDEVSLKLLEIVNPSLAWDDGFFGELPFWAGRFRPVVIPEADIAQFEAILRGVEKRRLVDA